MAAITAQLVKELRERTGAGMMECKKALTETNGDIEAAVEAMRKAGLAKADKKAGRVAAEGSLAISLSNDGKIASLVEINCETDFVANGDEFQAFAKQVAELARTQNPADVDALNALEVEAGKSVDERRRELIAKIGENMTVRRFATVSTSAGILGSYLHGKKIGVIVEMEGGDAQLAKDIAMQVAATDPMAIDVADLPAEFVAKEKEIAMAKYADSGKPADIVEKIVSGALNKTFKEVTLLGQFFIKDDKKTIADLLNSNKAKVVRYTRFKLGEGIEKKDEVNEKEKKENKDRKSVV